MIWEGQSKKVITLYAKARNLGKDPEYHEAREISWEAGGPPSKAKYSLVTDSEQVP